jgi:hypothetical protein
MAEKETRIDLYNGKYTILHTNGVGLRALRYGEPWCDLTGNGLVLAAAHEIEELQTVNARLRDELAERTAQRDSADERAVGLAEEAKRLRAEVQEQVKVAREYEEAFSKATLEKRVAEAGLATEKYARAALVDKLGTVTEAKEVAEAGQAAMVSLLRTAADYICTDLPGCTVWIDEYTAWKAQPSPGVAFVERLEKAEGWCRKVAEEWRSVMKYDSDQRRGLSFDILEAMDEIAAAYPAQGAPAKCCRCGACCRRQPCPPFGLGYPELADHPDLLAEITAYIDSPEFDDDAPCLWLTPTGCKHYDLRPAICRDFEAQGECCEHPARGEAGEGSAR